jgi:3-hydroxy-9,10-secoandrosta-1,3,5(10)-triene-9,17-dione monooxygenase reductase component
MATRKVHDEPVDEAAFRRVLAEFATGVTVITVQRGDHIHGMTANAFTSVSLDPPLVLFCVTKSARMAALIRDAHGFAINILSDRQREVSRQFAGTNKEHIERAVALQRGPLAPLIDGCLAALSCTIAAIHDGGDHWIVVGRVVGLHLSESRRAERPLLFFRSRYHELVEQVPAPRQPVEAWANDAIRIYHEEWSADDDSGEPEHPPPW